ncbi:PSMB4 family protein [Megaselia abdita]
MIAADALVSYGSVARFQDVKRVFKVNDQAILGTGGDFADFQSIQRSINDKMIDDICHDDTISLKPKSLYNWLTRILNNRRNKFEPLWLDMVVGGIENGEPFLGHVDLRGRSYEDDIIATGFGKHLALPIIREQIVEGRPFTQEEATNLIKKSMEVLFYRDCRALSRYYVAVCTAAGANVSEVQKVNQNWEVATVVRGYS